MNRKPDFICPGLPKAGTTTLHRMLERHPDFRMPPVKEIKYLNDFQADVPAPRIRCLSGNHTFARQDRVALVHAAGRMARLQDPAYTLRATTLYFFAPVVSDRWYTGLFARDRISGDITPGYFSLDSDAVHAWAQRFPDRRIVLLLRHPVWRHWSHLRMARPDLTERSSGVTGLQILRRRLAHLSGRVGTYADLVRRWRRYFGSQNVFVGFFDDMVSDSRAFWRDLFRFLGGRHDEATVDGVVEVAGSPANARGPANVPDTLKPDLQAAACRELFGFDDLYPDRARAWFDDPVMGDV